MNSDGRTFFVTSALPYANGEIHLGKLLEDIQADIWVRYQRLRGHVCIFCCADDAHGSPMMLKAQQAGVAPEELATRMQAAHQRDFQGFLISHDCYHTTHCEDNRQLSCMVYERLQEAGLIYTREVEQFFDTEQQMFLADRFLKGGCPRCGAEDQYGDNCEKCGATYDATELKAPRSVLSGSIPELRNSTHYFFDLAKLQPFLEDWANTDTLQPEVHNKIREWLDAGLQPWDISRDAPYFGFVIPGTTDKYFYVWVDAPLGYMSTLKQLATERDDVQFDAIWAADSKAEVHHFIGKDIVNFHALFWPAMLHAANFRTPTRIHTHGFLTVNGARMSKSRGTFINAATYLRHLDPEYLRYYFAARLGSGVEDLDLSLDDFVTRVNADLIGKLVNIAARCAKFINQGQDNWLSAECANEELWQQAVQAGDEIGTLYETGNYNQAIRKIMSLADEANQYIAEARPWQLAKQPECKQEVQAICSLGLNLFRVLMVYLKPVLPKLAEDTERLLKCAPLDWRNRGDWLGAQQIDEFHPLKQRVDPKQVQAMVQASKTSATGAAQQDDNTGAAENIASVIDLATFARVDLRIARVQDAETIAEAGKLLKLTLDVGSLGQRTVLAGIKSAYTCEQLIGRKVVLVANLAPRKMRFGTSEGMLLAAGSGADGIFLLAPDDGATPGMQVR